MKTDMKTRLEAMGFVQIDTITLGRREIPVFGMKMMKDKRKAGHGQPNGQDNVPSPSPWSN